MAPPPISSTKGEAIAAQLSETGGGVARIAVIGGGISGLAYVHRLLELKEEKNFPDSVIQ